MSSRLKRFTPVSNRLQRQAVAAHRGRAGSGRVVVRPPWPRLSASQSHLADRRRTHERERLATLAALGFFRFFLCFPGWPCCQSVDHLGKQLGESAAPRQGFLSGSAVAGRSATSKSASAGACSPRRPSLVRICGRGGRQLPSRPGLGSSSWLLLAPSEAAGKRVSCVHSPPANRVGRL